MTRSLFDPPSEPPDGDPVCRICDHTMELTLVGWECTHDHDAEQEAVNILMRDVIRNSPVDTIVRRLPCQPRER